MVDPEAAALTSTSVACWLDGLVKVSLLSWVSAIAGGGIVCSGGVEVGPEPQAVRTIRMPNTVAASRSFIRRLSDEWLDAGCVHCIVYACLCVSLCPLRFPAFDFINHRTRRYTKENGESSPSFIRQTWAPARYRLGGHGVVGGLRRLRPAPLRIRARCVAQKCAAYSNAGLEG